MVHRVFSRLGLRGKTAIGLGALILAISAIMDIAGYWQARNFAEKRVFELEQSKFELMSHTIDAALTSDREDLLSMRGVNSVLEIVRAGDAGGIDPVSGKGLEVLSRKLGTTFQSFMANHPQYLQMRYIDERGEELVRVQRKGASVQNAPADELHNEADHPYVAETLRLPVGHIRTSDVHLQQEHGQMAVPHMPALMLATPVYSEKNVVRGMVETTISTDFLFRAVVSEAGGAQRKISDEKGYFIKHPDPSKTFGFDLGFDYRLRDEEPDLVQIAQKQDTFIRHHPEHKEMDGFKKIYFDPENHSRYWLLALNIPDELVFGEIDAFLNAMLAAVGIIGILAALIILWFVSRKIVSPIVRLADAASLMQGGNMTIRVDEASVKDEFRTLYATINAFADSQQHATARLEQEVRQAMDRVAESEVQNRLILDSAGDGIYGLDQQGNATFINPIACRMLGYEPDELLGQAMHSLARHSSPDGMPYPRDKCPLCATLIDGQTHEVKDAVLWRKDGTSFSVECICTPMLRDGALVGVVATFRDITERKKVEEELRLSSLVYQTSSEGMLVTDADNRIIAVNPAFSAITGYNFADVKGKNPRMFSSGRHDAAFFKAMWHEISTTGHWQGEIWDRRKSGEIHANWLTINTIRNEQGQVQRYVALFSDITEKKLSEELIWKQANFDALTELPNRRMFLDRLEQEAKKSDRAGLPLALLLIDLDQFKEVNDTLGHDMGDILLQQAARRIHGCVRESDTVARLGGDEFTVILSELPDDARHVEDIAQKIIGKLAEPFHLGDEIAYISASIGITLYPSDAADIDALMKNVDQAMYVAKNKGRNRFSYFTPQLQEAAQTRLRLSKDLRGALAAREFSVCFQPIVELATGRIHKAEALIRWQHATRGLVSPQDFIPLTEETGLIHEIGDWVFREAAGWAKRWSHQFAEEFKVSVNMSPVQFRAEGRVFAVQWLRHLQELGISGKNIAVEITEGLLLNADPDIIDKLLVFRDAGIQVAIDDFGTGYSSLSYLKKFDIDYLKIDQSFVRNLETDPDDMALSEAIIVMAHKLGLKVIAEGVETEGQRRLLADAGCDYAQGYLFARPMPPEEFEVMMKNKLFKA